VDGRYLVFPEKVIRDFFREHYFQSPEIFFAIGVKSTIVLQIRRYFYSVPRGFKIPFEFGRRLAMRTVVYLVWFLIPLSIIGIALWNFIENKAKKKVDRYSGQLLRQALFTSLCVGVAVLCEQFALDFVMVTVMQGFVPREIILVLLLPLVMVVAATVIGPTAAISITKAPVLTRKSSR
jgi:hypothetical protein